MSVSASNRIGRTAALLHAIGAAAATGTEIFVNVPAVTRNMKFEEAAPIIAVGGAAACVLIVWSCVMSVRALKSHERPGWPCAVLVMALFEAAGLSIFHAQLLSNKWVLGWGMPVFLPAFAIAALIAGCFSWWRTNRAEKRSAAAGGPAWLLARRIKYGLRLFIPVAALIFMCIVPVPLFLFSVSQLTHGNNRAWNKWVVDQTPVFVADAGAELALRLNSKPFAGLYESVIASGRVRKERLLRELYTPSTPRINEVAFWGLYRVDPEAALDYADQIANGKLKAASTGTYWHLGWYYAQHGSIEKIRDYLNPGRPVTPVYAFQVNLIASLKHFHPELWPDLERFAGGNPPICRKEALRELAVNSKPADAERLWLSYLKDADPRRLKEAAEAASCIDDDSVRSRILPKYLCHSDPTVREAALSEYFICRPVDKLSAEFASALQTLLDDPDLMQRRRAACVLAAQTNSPRTLASKAISRSMPGGIPAPETKQEIDERDEIREDTRKWLAAQK